MPALPPVPGVIRLRLLGVSDGVPSGSRFFLRYTGGPPSNADVSSICGQFMTLWAAHILPLISAAYTLDQVVGEDLTSSTSASGASTNAPVAGGNSAGSFVPDSVCAVLSWTIARRYRGGKPRTYLGPLRSSDFNDGRTLIASAALAFANAADLVLTNINTLTAGTTAVADLGTVSYYTARALRPVPLFEAFLSADMDLRPGSQRRRLGKLSAIREV